MLSRPTAGLTSIQRCNIIPVKANGDHRGCLYEIFREEWEGGFHAVQWNACASKKGVLRGASCSC